MTPEPDPERSGKEGPRCHESLSGDPSRKLESILVFFRGNSNVTRL